jgi:hypothetical protein
VNDHDRRTGGAMTRAMSAQRSTAVTRALRVGVLQENTHLEERLVRERNTVSAGTTEHATLTVSTKGFPQHVELFVMREGRWHLRVDPSAEGRIAHGTSVRSLMELREHADTQHREGACFVALDDQSRGKVTLAGVTFLFQFVPVVADAPRPQVPTALRKNLTRDIDWRYNFCLSAFMMAALGGLTWIEYGYDPVVDDTQAMLDLMTRRVHLTPPEDPSVPEPESAEAAATPGETSAPSRAEPGPSQNRPSQSRPSPTRADTQRAAERAEHAAATAVAAMQASFAAITSLTQGPQSAVDQLHRQVLMQSTENDLRNTHGITTNAPSNVARRALAVTHAPNATMLGRSTTLASATHEPGTTTVVREVGPTRHLSLHTEEPETDTCTGDAQPVTRAIRGGLGGFRTCYEHALRDNPTLSGRMTLRFTVGESGRVTEASASGLTPVMAACIERAVHRIVFPVPTCGAAEYAFPFNYDAGER